MRLAAALTALLGGLFVVYGVTVEASTAGRGMAGLPLIALGMLDIGIAWALHRGWLRARAERRVAGRGAAEDPERGAETLDRTAA